MDKELRSHLNHFLTLTYMTTESDNKYLIDNQQKIKPSDLAKYISGFANAEGGTLVIGISDTTKTIEGVDDYGSDKINDFLTASKNFVLQRRISSCNKP